MQEEVEQKTVTLIINTSKLTEQTLQKGIAKLLERQKENRANPHGKMSVKKLAEQNRGMQSVEVTDKNIGSFNRIARKYGIDFAPFKVKGQNKYMVFFKSQDQDAMTAAFEAYTAKVMKKDRKPSVLAKLAKFKELIKAPVADKTRKKELER